MKNTSLLLRMIFFSLMLWACQSSKNRDVLSSSDSMDPIPYQEEQAELPSPMWSPMKRQLTASSNYLYGEYAYLRKDFKSAYQFFDRAYRLDPNVFLALKTVELRAQMGEVKEALEECQKLVLFYPNNPKIHTLYGKLSVAANLYDQAILHFEQAINLDSHDPEPYIGLIQIYRYKKQNFKALYFADELTKKNPSIPEGWILSAKLYLGVGQKKKALIPAQRAYDLRSNDPDVILIYAIVLDLNGQPKKAVQLYEALFRENPTDEPLIERMVAIYRDMGDLNNALTLLKEADNNVVDTNINIKMQEAFILWELKRYDEAATILENLALKYPESDRVLYLSALGKERLGKIDEAIKYFQKIPEGSPYRVHGDFRIIKILVTRKQYKEAIDIVNKIVDAKSDRSVEFYAVGAEIFDESHEYAKAVEFLRKGVKEYPSDASVLFLLGVYSEKNGDVDGCIKVMNQVIVLDPEFSSAYNYLGYLYADRGEQLDKAEELIRHALKLKPNDGYYLDSLGWVFYHEKQYDKALKAFVEALKAVPDEGVILEHIGDVYRAKGNKAAAVEYYKKALNGRLESKDKGRIESRLELLEKNA